jgi:hypothetical protein
MEEYEIVGRGGLMVRKSRFLYVAWQGIGEFRANDLGVGVGFGRAPGLASEPGLFVKWDDIEEIVFGPASFVLRSKGGPGARFATINATPVEHFRRLAQFKGCPQRFLPWTLPSGLNIGIGPWPGVSLGWFPST